MKNAGQVSAIKRREFLRNAARMAALGGLAAVFAVVGRNSRKASTSADCRRDFICQRCPLVPGCALPEASSFRSERRKESLS
jgi:hypothetical protein